MSPPVRRRSTSIPIPAHAVPVSNQNRPAQQRERRRSGVLQSSLDLVFSYSRSQQLRYGQVASSGSAPSFVDGYPSSRSHSHSSPEGQLEEDANEEEYTHRDVRTRWTDIEAAAENSPSSIGEAEGPWAAEATFFPSDPFAASQAQAQAFKAAGPATRTDVKAANSPTSQSLTSPDLNRPFVNNYFTPLSSTISRSSINTTGSSSATKTAKKIAPTSRRAEVRPSISVAPEAQPTEQAPLLGKPDRKYSAIETSGDTLDVPRGRRISATPRRQSDSASLELGRSTDGQTLFNATAVLVGIGLLSLPLAFAYAGWVGGSLMLLSFGWLTCYTAKLLARLIRADRSMLGYTDIGRKAFGTWAGGLINVLFCLELFALGVALIVLFGDSLNIIFPSIASNTWKMIGFIIILPTALLPLRLLSLPSLLSSVSSLLLVVVVLIDGFHKASAPGSLREPMPTRLGPELEGYNWLGGIGLVLAGFGGHAVMPSLARDMKRPENFDAVVNKAFAIATMISFVAGAAGYLMIGQTVSDEITRDMMVTKYQYPRGLNLFALWMIVVNPLSKFGLSSRPLNVTIESLLGIAPSVVAPTSVIDRAAADSVTDYDQSNKSDSLVSRTGVSPCRRFTSTSSARPSSISVEERGRARFASISTTASETHPPLTSVKAEKKKAILRVISRTIVTALCTGTAIALPGFGRVMAFLGSFSAFLICIILPLLFYIQLEPTLVSPHADDAVANGNAKLDVRRKAQSTFHWALIAISTGLMVAGTVWAFIPGSGHGGLEE